MKFNWGTGIALFYGTFVIVLVFAVFKSRTYDNSLVSDHYYADDLAYQQHYNKLKNNQTLLHDLNIIKEDKNITFQFPAEVGTAQGEIQFFCPFDSKQDFKVTISPDNKQLQIVDISKLKTGRWKIKVNWQANGKDYYKEEAIIL
ncbi:MAG: FixH family protein [Saprospiraceae bacterium]